MGAAVELRHSRLATMSAPMLAATVEATLVNSPNKHRLRNLSMKISSMGDELSHEKQARADAVELKLKVLDDKLLRAQIAEDEQLKPLNDQIARYVEELSAERLSRESMDERKTKEIKSLESSISQSSRKPLTDRSWTSGSRG